MDSVRPAKRQRTSGYISPPLGAECAVQPLARNRDESRRMSKAVNVLKVEAEALAQVAILYETDDTARNGLGSAVDRILDAQHYGGKLIVCGVGKSAYIGSKLVATCKSLGIRASFLHAAEAAHGDLGDIRSEDVLLFVSFSGRTPELLNLLPHIPESTCVIAMSSSPTREECQLLGEHEESILLPTPIHEKEEATFGVCAPTTSTTVTLAVADMLALTIADELHSGKTKEVFKRNHPGGAIGLKNRASNPVEVPVSDVSPVELPSPSISDESED